MSLMQLSYFLTFSKHNVITLLHNVHTELMTKHQINNALKTIR